MLYLTSPPLHYKSVGLQTAGLATKPIFFLPKFAEKEWAEGNVYMQLFIINFGMGAQSPRLADLQKCKEKNNL